MNPALHNSSEPLARSVAKSVAEKKLSRSRSSKEAAATLQVYWLSERALQMTGGTNARELGRAYRVLI